MGQMKHARRRALPVFNSPFELGIRMVLEVPDSQASAVRQALEHFLPKTNLVLITSNENNLTLKKEGQ